MALSDSSVISSFKFQSFKVDEFRFSMEKQLGLLAFQGCYTQEDWEAEISIRKPTFYEANNFYLSGVKFKLSLVPGKTPETKPLAILEGSISGLFSTENRFKPEDEEALVQYQMPAILFPYLRSAVTSFLANAGFGSFIFPLINMQEIARRTMKDIVPIVISTNQ